MKKVHIDDAPFALGLPEWATEEEVRAAAQAAGVELVDDEPVVEPAPTGMAAKWAAVHDAAIVARAEAIRHGAEQYATVFSNIAREAELSAFTARGGVCRARLPEKGENRVYDALYALIPVSAEALAEARRVCAEYDARPQRGRRRA